jgi:hypothetical protein
VIVVLLLFVPNGLSFPYAMKEIEVSSNEKATPEKIIPLTTLKEITPVASLNNDSPSMIVFSLCGNGNILNMTNDGDEDERRRLCINALLC